MRRYLLDTGVASDYLNRRHGICERARTELTCGNRVGICIPVLAELWYGVEYSTSRDRNVNSLRRGLSDLVIWPFERDAAEAYGRLYAELRRSGRAMQVPDVMSAAIALTLGRTTVVTDDRDLRAVPGLDVESWVTEAP